MGDLVKDHLADHVSDRPAGLLRVLLDRRLVYGYVIRKDELVSKPAPGRRNAVIEAEQRGVARDAGGLEVLSAGLLLYHHAHVAILELPSEIFRKALYDLFDQRFKGFPLHH